MEIRLLAPILKVACQVAKICSPSQYKSHIETDIYRPRSEGDNALGSVRPSVCALTSEPYDLQQQRALGVITSL